MYGFSPDCSVLYNGPKGKENREGDRRIGKKEENKRGNDKLTSSICLVGFPLPPRLLSLACTHTHTHTHTCKHALTEMKFIKTRNWLLRLSETYNSKRALFNA